MPNKINYCKEKNLDIDYYLNEKIDFRDLSSEIEDIIVEYREFGYGSFYLGCRQKREISATDLTENLYCCNPLCVNGGFSIGEIIRGMIREGETKREFHVLCSGNEGSALGGQFFKKCYNSFTGRVIIKYKK